MSKKRFFIRYFILIAIFIVSVFIYGAQLLNLQIANHDLYRFDVGSDGTYKETFIVQAVRGEIFDRNGVPLVTNRNINNLVIDGKKLYDAVYKAGNTADYVQVIIDLVNLANKYGGTIETDTLPIKDLENSDGTHSYAYDMVVTSSESQARKNLDRFLGNNKLSLDTSANELVTFLNSKYKLDDYLPVEIRDQKLFRTILGICYDFEKFNVLRGDKRYILCKDIDAMMMTVVKENSHNYPGAEADLAYERVYHFPDTAPHLMGTIGPIYAEEVDHYLEKGYSMDAIVGKSGIELAFEDYLRGQDGTIVRTYDQDGNVIGEEWAKDSKGNEKKAVPGKNVYLTIDIKLQQVAEYSLEKTIGRIHMEAAQTSNPELNGATANAGAAAVINPNNGEILALPTYPSYSLLDLQDPEKLAVLLADEKNSPFTNRALKGQYAPGSIFKIVTSVAGLCSGHLSLNEYIEDKGVYTKYGEPAPACWIWNMYKTTHPPENVIGALKDSCNYFFYTVGDRMGISTLAEYAKRLGFGVNTGIEVGENTGVLSSPEAAEARGYSWNPGDLLQTSIGQAYNVFTPLQMVTMLGAVLDGGTRYASHLLLYVKEYGSDSIYYSPEPEIMDQVAIPGEYVDAIKQGLGEVMDPGGTGARLFKGAPFPNSFTVGGKTGTVQILKDMASDNGTFVGFAPYSEPEIAISTVIEKGAKGTWAGFVAEDVFAYYFGYKTFNQSMDLPDEPEEIEESEESQETTETAE